jgi:biotin synthase
MAMYLNSEQDFTGDFKKINLIRSFPTKGELQMMLNARGELQNQLFEKARQVRHLSGMDFCLLRGVIEISNHCQKNCFYCAMRAANRSIRRYRMSLEEILVAAERIVKTGITVVFLQGGQDPKMDPVVAQAIVEIKKRYHCSVILCLGERHPETYQMFYSAGADAYILKFETSDPLLYRAITNANPKKRLQCIEQLRDIGFKIGVGNIIGLPDQTLDSFCEDMLLSMRLNPDFVSCAPFIPNEGVPLEHMPYGDLNTTLNWMAICRIFLKTCLIPSVSALEKIQKGAQLTGLNAGANVMTINFTPNKYRKKYSIYSKQRFVVSIDHALETANSAGLDVILDK